jgi:hypothetical protein
MKIFSKSAIAEKIKRPKRTITSWADFGYIHPDDPRERRPGRAREFSERNLIEYGMVDAMNRLGVKLKTVKLIMDYIQPDAGNIQDFFGDSKWGKTRELAYIEFTTSQGESDYRFQFIKSDKEILKFVGMNPENPKQIATIIWLGQIKQQALELLS